jgi:hypothetical protein
MGRKGRDPKYVTTEPVPPWKENEPCPCGSRRLYARCCHGIDGRAHKTPIGRCPPSPETGFSHERCYMGWTQDCDKQISGEHYIFASVLKHLGGSNVMLNGVHWQAPNETKTLPVIRLKAKILCKRHSEAMAGLDTMAGEFFSALKLVYDDIHNKKTLSRRSKWFLFSGEELELWMLKTAVGLFHSGVAAKERFSLKEEQTTNPECYDILYCRTLLRPCGIYIEPINISKQAEIQWQPASDVEGRKMVVLRMTYLCFAFTLLFDPAATYGPERSPRGHIGQAG